jgi:hypothetical protein
MVRTSTRSGGTTTNHTIIQGNQNSDRPASGKASRDGRIPGFARPTRASANAANATKTTPRATAHRAINTAQITNGSNDVTKNRPPTRSALSSLDANIPMLRLHKSPRPSVVRGSSKLISSGVKAKAASVRATINLQSLPVELFDEIMSLVLESVDPVKALHLRVVSSKLSKLYAQTRLTSHRNFQCCRSSIYL